LLLRVRLLVSDLNAAEFSRIRRKAGASRGWLIVIGCVAIA
jgi:hypothetical protein